MFPLSPAQEDAIAWEAWASRVLWLALANPRGFPPALRADTAPVAVLALVNALGCPFCAHRASTRDALAVRSLLTSFPSACSFSFYLGCFPPAAI